MLQIYINVNTVRFRKPLILVFSFIDRDIMAMYFGGRLELAQEGCMNAMSDLLVREYELRVGLGSQFIDAAQVTTVLGVDYRSNDGQLQKLLERLPDPEMFRRGYQSRDFVVIAGPPKEMNLFRIHAVDRKLFMLTWKELIDQSWFDDVKHFVVPATEWLVLRRSSYETFSGVRPHWLQWQAGSSSWSRPNIATLAYMHAVLAQIPGISVLKEQQSIPSSSRAGKKELSVCLYQGKVYI